MQIKLTLFKTWHTGDSILQNIFQTINNFPPFVPISEFGVSYANSFEKPGEK